MMQMGRPLWSLLVDPKIAFLAEKGSTKNQLNSSPVCPALFDSDGQMVCFLDPRLVPFSRLMQMGPRSLSRD